MSYRVAPVTAFHDIVFWPLPAEADTPVGVVKLTSNVKVDEFVEVLLDPVAVKTKLTVPVAFGVPLTVKLSVLLPVPEVVVATVAHEGLPLIAHVYASEGLVEVAVIVEEAL